MAKGIAYKGRRVRLELDIVAEFPSVIRGPTSLIDNRSRRRVTV